MAMVKHAHIRIFCDQVAQRVVSHSCRMQRKSRHAAGAISCEAMPGPPHASQARNPFPARSSCKGHLWQRAPTGFGHDIHSHAMVNAFCNERHGMLLPLLVPSALCLWHPWKTRQLYDIIAAFFRLRSVGRHHSAIQTSLPSAREASARPLLYGTRARLATRLSGPCSPRVPAVFTVYPASVFSPLRTSPRNDGCLHRLAPATRATAGMQRHVPALCTAVCRRSS